jgi:alanyl-tRNA synthetase
MVQFKDVFLGTDQRPYVRAANSQKCMRVAGKHNDLDDVGRDDTHHTFFEMLGNWSFGDYYKTDAIALAWELLTTVWGLPKDKLWATCFEDEREEIERDNEAAQIWVKQPGFDSSHVIFFGRKDNFWEMAETGPTGPTSEIHLDLGPGNCIHENEAGHECEVNLDGCTRYLELWNLVFMQYNRTSPTNLEPLPATHVDTGLGLDRIVSVLQGVNSNYKTDLLGPTMDAVQSLTGHSDEEKLTNITPYRVITDHARAAAFLIADGVVPGNTGRNYVSRMIVRRAARFGSLIGLEEPFLAHVAESVIDNYGDFYPELSRNRAAILENLLREEKRFQRTVEAGVSKLENLLEATLQSGTRQLNGEKAFDLYATYGLPLEITRDIARDKDIQVEDQGFQAAMEEHRLASGAGESFGEFSEENIVFYRDLLKELVEEGKIEEKGVNYDPYNRNDVEGKLLALIKDGDRVTQVKSGDKVEVLIADTPFYIEAGGQVSDIGSITSLAEPSWEIQIHDIKRPTAGVILHLGEVTRGEPVIGARALTRIDQQRRQDIMRNHTATHLLHAELQSVLGDHARQAGSLVAPDRLRFDFTHPDALALDELDKIEVAVNQDILSNYSLQILHKPLQQAIDEGAIALFGEKYAETVRTITIGRDKPFSYELCGGTHVDETGDIGTFLIISESSVGAGLRRIEAVTGRGAYQLIHERFQDLNQTARLLDTTPDQIVDRTRSVLDQLDGARKQIKDFRSNLIGQEFNQRLQKVPRIDGVPVLVTVIPDADADSLRKMADRFRQKYESGVILLASVSNGRPILIAAVTEDLVGRGLHAGELVKYAAHPLGGSGGGRPTLAQAGGKDPDKLDQALALAETWIQEKLLVAQP